MDECYIYETPGDEEGLPHNDTDIIYDTVPDEIIQLAVDGDELKRKGKYVYCVKPKEGWVYLPDHNAQYDWGALDEIYEEKKQERIEELERLKSKEEGDDAKKEEDAANYDEDGYLRSGDTEVYGAENDDDIGMSDDDEDAPELERTLIADIRRDFFHQRMMAQTKGLEMEPTTNKLMQIKRLRQLIFYFRRHPFLPGISSAIYFRFMWAK